MTLHMNTVLSILSSTHILYGPFTNADVNITSCKVVLMSNTSWFPCWGEVFTHVLQNAMMLAQRIVLFKF